MTMKNFIPGVMALTLMFLCCEKKNNELAVQETKNEGPEKKHGPYGKTSKWKSISGDTVYEETLTLTYFYTEKNSPCNVCYYQQNYPLWTDYDYTYAVSECAAVNDTLTITDIDTGRKAIFKREK